ncbi:hypothetical protein BaRGS_00032531 [Batillaria attramentaria]|uniref:Uncharacterized protein n=1 Tax=Batillaria attramentaria TaxID=370345 RepID=A0ABD0JMJ4_9CAEN
MIALHRTLCRSLCVVTWRSSVLEERTRRTLTVPTGPMSAKTGSHVHTFDRTTEKFRYQEHPTNVLHTRPEDFGTDTNDLREVGTNQEERIKSILNTWPKDKLHKLIRVAQLAEVSSTDEEDPTTSSLQTAMLSGAATSTSDGGDVPLATFQRHHQEEGKKQIHVNT